MRIIGSFIMGDRYVLPNGPSVRTALCRAFATITIIRSNAGKPGTGDMHAVFG